MSFPVSSMSFPVYLRLGGLMLHPHTVFELLGYFVGFRLYLSLRRRSGDVIGGHDRWSIVGAAVLGAAIGSRVLFWLEDPATTLARFDDPSYLVGGKTVVGGLLGGWMAVELTKRMLGIRTRTGDVFAIPLAVGIAIGRIGCFLTGPSDLTWGVATTAPWAIDPGDGVARHPTPLYEAVFLAALVPLLARWSRTPRPAGWLFRAFMVGYLGLRLLIDAIKPEIPLALGLGAIQWACVAALAYYAALWRPSQAFDAADARSTS
jgi:phosphatidylglycerol:prolipoprotein diacylglycerol transferase